MTALETLLEAASTYATWLERASANPRSVLPNTARWLLDAQAEAMAEQATAIRQAVTEVQGLEEIRRMTEDVA